MKSQDIRQSFVDFFRRHDHRPVVSSPLVPHGDPTLLFTNAGMVQFKDAFLGLEKPASKRAVTVQKCLRVSGKHNDLENVGPSPRHHTFFEMLGNFSFGDYFKRDAIRFGWDLVTGPWGLDPAHLFTTVYEEDDEAEKLWLEISDLPQDRVRRCGKADNFWAMGETGPCGPCSEIFVDRTPGEPLVSWEEGTDSGRYLEIWNLVFMQYQRHEDGRLEPLPNPSIDTGAGLERVTAVLQGVASNYDTDLFQPILKATAAMAGGEYGRDPQVDTSLRVVADHLRAVSFLLADGVVPGPDGRGYVLRRLLRRAVRHGMRIGFEEPFLHRLVGTLGEVMGGAYPELGATRSATEATVEEEERKYRETRAGGARRIQAAIDRVRAAGGSTLPGDEIFALYDTYGQEIDAVREIAQEEKLGLDEAGFARLLEERREGSRAATGELQGRMASLREALYGAGDLQPSEFLGWESTHLQGARVVRLARTGDETRAVDALTLGQRGVAVLDRTVFYAESGGQVGDHGALSWPGGRATVVDTQKDAAGVVFHFVEVTAGTLAAGAELDLQVDDALRRSTERNHTATHLLHAALREVLGTSVRQAGSLVSPDRLRFDFTYGKPLTSEERRRIESLVNREIRRATPVQIVWRGHQEAVAAGAMALFGEKYGERVRTVGIDGFSLELCGGCHVRSTGEIALCLLVSERGVASGVRRIEAVTGEGALERVRSTEHALDETAAALGVAPDRAAQAAAESGEKIKALERELAKLRVEMVTGSGAAASDEREVKPGVKVVAREVPPAPAADLRQMADTIRDRLGSGVALLGCREGEKVSIVVAVSRDLTDRVKAGDLVRELAPLVGGAGGGRPDFAQAGGKDPAGLPRLLAAALDAVATRLG